MAESITLPDGTQVPQWSKESTQERMHELLKAMVASDDKALKVYQKLIDQVEDSGDEAQQAAKEAKQIQQEQLKQTKEVADAARKGKLFSGEVFKKSMMAVDGFLTKSFMSVGSGALGLATTLAVSINEIGQDLLDLQQAGVGFTDATGSAEKLMADLNFLGIASSEAAGLMKNYAGVVQIMGKTGFSDIQRAFADITGSGSLLGLSMEQSAAVLAEDLDLRKTLGMLDELDAAAQAKRSSELYQQQLQAAQALGKSVEEIREGNKSLMENNFNFQISQARTMARLGEKAGALYLESVESLSTEFQGMGLGQNIQDAMLTAMSEPVAFLNQGGAELYEALATTGERGQNIANRMQTIGQLMQGTAEEQEQARKMMAEFGPQLKGDLAAIMKDDSALQAMQNIANEGGPAAGMIKELFFSSQSAKVALAGAANSLGSFQSGLAKASQAYGAAMDTIAGTMSGAMTDLTGAFAGPVGAFADALTKDTILRNENGEILDKNGKAMTRMAKVYDENGNVVGEQLETIKDYNDLSAEQRKQMTGTASVMSVFRDAIQTIRETIMKSFGLAGDDVTNLSEKIREYLIPKVEEFAAWFQGGGWESIKSGFLDLKDGIVALTAPFRVFYNLFTGDVTGAVNSMSDVFGSTAAVVGGLVGAFILTTKTLKLYNAAQGMATKGMEGISKLKNLFGKAGGGVAGGSAGSGVLGKITGTSGATPGAATGQAVAKQGASFSKTIAKAGTNIGVAIKNLGKGIGGAIQGLAEGIAKGVAAVGKGIGNALGGILQGLAKGLAAFANPAILVGAGILGGAITLIGAGVAGAAWIMGKSLPTFAEGLNSFANIDGDNLVNVAKGIGAIGLAMAAMGAGGAAGSVGTAVSGVVDGIMGFFGADDPLDKINEFAAYKFDVAAVLMNAKAVQAFGDAMIAMGAGVAAMTGGALIDGLAEFAGADPISMINTLAENINLEGINSNIEAMDRVQLLFNKFAELDPQGTGVTATTPPQTLMAPRSGAPVTTPTAAEAPVVMATNSAQAFEMPDFQTEVMQGMSNEQLSRMQDMMNQGGGSATGMTQDENGRTFEALTVLIGETKKTNQMLGKLDNSVQDTF